MGSSTFPNLTGYFAVFFVSELHCSRWSIFPNLHVLGTVCSRSFMFHVLISRSCMFHVLCSRSFMFYVLCSRSFMFHVLYSRSFMFTELLASGTEPHKHLTAFPHPSSYSFLWVFENFVHFWKHKSEPALNNFIVRSSHQIAINYWSNDCVTIMLCWPWLCVFERCTRTNLRCPWL